MHAIRKMYQQSQNYWCLYLIHLYLSLQYDDRCSDITGVYLFGPHFRFAQTRPMTLAVCVNNMIFFSNFNKEIYYIHIVIY